MGNAFKEALKSRHYVSSLVKKYWLKASIRINKKEILKRNRLEIINVLKFFVVVFFFGL